MSTSDSSGTYPDEQGGIAAASDTSTSNSRGKYIRKPASPELLQAREGLKQTRKEALSLWKLNARTQRKFQQAKDEHSLTGNPAAEARVEQLHSEIKQQKATLYLLRKKAEDWAERIVTGRRQETLDSRRADADALADQYEEDLRQNEAEELRVAMEQFTKDWHKDRDADLKRRRSQYLRELRHSLTAQQQKTLSAAKEASKQERERFKKGYQAIKAKYGLTLGAQTAENKKLKRAQKAKVIEAELRKIEVKRKRLEAALQKLTEDNSQG